MLRDRDIEVGAGRERERERERGRERESAPPGQQERRCATTFGLRSVFIGNVAGSFS